jgi:hypothetical protein
MVLLPAVLACTSIGVGKKATVDGSTLGTCSMSRLTLQKVLIFIFAVSLRQCLTRTMASPTVV